MASTLCSLLAHGCALLALVLLVDSLPSALRRPFQRPGLGPSDGDPPRMGNCTGCSQRLVAHIEQKQKLHSFQRRLLHAIKGAGNNVSLNAPKTTGKRVDAGSDRKPVPSSVGEQQHPDTSGHGSTSGRSEPTHSHVSSSNRSSSRTDESGPDILSLSRIIWSGRRGNLLQFTLNPSKLQGGEVEVVKAYLWLLLGKPRRPSHRRKVKDKGDPSHSGTEIGRNNSVNKNKAMAKATDSDDFRNEASVDTDMELKKRERRRRELQMSAVRSVAGEVNDDKDDKTDDLQGRSGGQKKEKQNNLNSRRMETESNDKDKNRNSDSKTTNNTRERSKKRRKPHPRNKSTRHEDGKEAQKEDSRDGKRKKAALRVLLVQKDGRKKLLTYLRTSVRRRHLKIVLPAGLVQEQLQQQNQTLTLMLRCSHCGRSVRMLLRGSKRQKQKSRKGKRRERRGKKEKNKAQLRDGREKYSVKKAKRSYSPSAVLVINTRRKIS